LKCKKVYKQNVLKEDEDKLIEKLDNEDKINYYIESTVSDLF